MQAVKVKKCCVLLVLLLLSGCGECSRRTSGSSRRTSSSSSRGGYSSSRIATNSYPRQTQGYVRPTQAYARPTQAYARPNNAYGNVQAKTVAPSYNANQNPGRVPQATTPRYNIRGGYNQPGYNQPGHNQPGYNQPGYNQPGGYRPGYNQPSYSQPGYHQPSYSQPGYHQPGYGFPSGNNYYQSGHNYGGYGYHKDHGTRNAIFAGLGGSALGAYLGYKIGTWSSSNNQQSVGPGGVASASPGSSSSYSDDVPRYSVVHYYYQGNQSIPQNTSVQASVIGKCDNSTNFCAPNSNTLCLTNGTIYCITPIASTVPCADNTTTASACINSTITLPCFDVNGTACNTATLNTTAIQIPCVSNISIFGSFDTNQLSVMTISNDTHHAETDVSSQGVSTKFCVTVIADPVPKPKELTNEQYLQYVNSNPEVKEDVSIKSENLLKTVLTNFFY